MKKITELTEEELKQTLDFWTDQFREGMVNEHKEALRVLRQEFVTTVNNEWQKHTEEGLRDQFAVAAMQGLLANSGINWGEVDLTELTSEVYVIADAMLIERTRSLNKNGN